jgi:hypothetical protein
MIWSTQFRTVLPVLQTVLAVLFGGWGLWLRNSILGKPFLENSTLWNSTARFHVWPFKFAAIMNMPPSTALPLGASPRPQSCSKSIVYCASVSGGVILIFCQTQADFNTGGLCMKSRAGF